jgi:hypothetical protein
MYHRHHFSICSAVYDLNERRIQLTTIFMGNQVSFITSSQWNLSLFSFRIKLGSTPKSSRKKIKVLSLISMTSLNNGSGIRGRNQKHSLDSSIVFSYFSHRETIVSLLQTGRSSIHHQLEACFFHSRRCPVLQFVIGMFSAHACSQQFREQNTPRANIQLQQRSIHLCDTQSSLYSTFM